MLKWFLNVITRGNQLIRSGICTSRLIMVSYQTWSVIGINYGNQSLTNNRLYNIPIKLTLQQKPSQTAETRWSIRKNQSIVDYGQPDIQQHLPQNQSVESQLQW